MNQETERYIGMGIDRLMKISSKIAYDKGWWIEDRNDGECIALMHSELSEALEAMREGKSKDEIAEEFADCIIRIADYCCGKTLNLRRVLIEKIRTNEKRSWRHGGKAF